MSSAHSPTFLSLHLRHSSFSNPSVALPTSHIILQPFRHFTYVTAHYPTLLSLYLRHSSFSNPYVASRTSQLILQSFFRFYVTGSSLTSPGEPRRMSSAHSPTFPSLHLRHSSFSNPSVALPTSHIILQPFCHCTYVTPHSPTLPFLHLRHSSFSNPSFASPTSQAIYDGGPTMIVRVSTFRSQQGNTLTVLWSISKA